MDFDDLDAGTHAALASAAKHGAELFAVGPMTPGQTVPTDDARVTLPGFQAVVAHRGLLVPGFGSDPDAAVRNALSKV